jgi:GAF domain-containing protein
MADQNFYDDAVTLASALRSLPLETPERSAWPALAARLAERDRRNHTRRQWRWPYAAAAAALLALALLPRGYVSTSDTTPAAVSGANVASAKAQLPALMSESARLERLLAAADDDGASSGSTAALGLQMEDALQHLDASLNSAQLTSAQQLDLWQQRVNLLRQIASLETSRHYYAAEGRNLDVALVSAY